ncbi:MAG TPA: response regulator transcription factor [Candidatus Polarisedimenticolaceae bacterium]|nr:response regulator transcription factor [Candidatus Polarisedimenticolaceae bacterium]
MKKGPTKILVVDDRVEFRRLFELYMQDHPDFEIVGTCFRADDLEDEIESLSPDVVVLDLSMPGREPLEALQAAKKRYAAVEFLVFSLSDEDEIVRRAMAAGATGYMVKEGGFDDLAEAIRSTARGERVVPRK